MQQNKTNNEKALELLKSLETYGYHEKNIKIGDVSIVMAPITAGETIEIFELSHKFNDADASTQSLKIETLARSIIKVNDVRFDPKSMLDEKKSVILAFGDELVDHLFDEYCELDKTIMTSIENRAEEILEAEGK